MSRLAERKPAKAMIKLATMWAYNHGVISGATVVRVFTRFDLWSA